MSGPWCLGCGRQICMCPPELPADPKQLLTDAEHQELRDDLARIADQRRRAEIESRDIPMA